MRKTARSIIVKCPRCEEQLSFSENPLCIGEVYSTTLAPPDLLEKLDGLIQECPTCKEKRTFYAYLVKNVIVF